MTEGRICHLGEPSLLSFNGDNIVSRERILARPRGLYEYMKSLIDAPDGHWLHREKEPKWFDRRIGKSTTQNPKFGHTLERLWHVLYDCADVTKVVDCEVTMEDPENNGGCSCLDKVEREIDRLSAV